MKKLLFIHLELVCGGAESALFNLLRLLDKTKYDVSVLVLRDGGVWEKKFEDEGIRVLHCYDRQIPGRKIRNALLRMRIDYARKHGGKGLIPVATGERFDLVVDYHNIAYFKSTAVSCPGKKIKYIHGDVRTNENLRGMVMAGLHLLPKFDRFICVSDEAKKAFTELVGMQEKSRLCYNPIDSSAVWAGAEIQPEEKLPERYICAVGRLSEEKGFSRLISIHKRILEKGLEHSLVIVGDGPERKNLEEQIHQLGVESSVLLTGYRSNPYCYMKGSLFTVCSSFTEGLPVIAMESLCLGVPIVSAYPSVGELFGNECCGIVTENDDDSLEAGICKMLTEKDYYEQAKAGAQKRSSVFASENMIKQVEQIYDSVMEES